MTMTELVIIIAGFVLTLAVIAAVDLLSETLK